MFDPCPKVGRVAPRAPLSVEWTHYIHYGLSVHGAREIPPGFGVRRLDAAFTFSAPHSLLSQRSLATQRLPTDRPIVPKGRLENSTAFQRRVPIAKLSSPEGTAELSAAQ